VIAEIPNVIEACVFGIWDPSNGDYAAALVVEKSGPQLEAQVHVRKHITTKYKLLNADAFIVNQIAGSGNRIANRSAAKAFFYDISTITRTYSTYYYYFILPFTKSFIKIK